MSERTVYRDMKDLVASGVGIEGEAGVGYVLREGFELPPLQFTRSELDALVAGARIVEAHGDGELARSARSALAKARATLPEPLRDALDRVPIHAPDFHLSEDRAVHLDRLRDAISASLELELHYQDSSGRDSSRVVRPVGLYFWGRTWSLLAWCTLREDYRNFRTDRIASLRVTDRPFDPGEHGLEDFLVQVRGESCGRDAED